MGSELPLHTAAERMIHAHRLRPQLSALAHRLLGNPHDVEDVVADAVLAAERSTAKDVAQLHAYLQVVVRRAAYELRQQPPLAQTARLAGHGRTIETNPAALVCDRAEDAWLTREVMAGLSGREQEVVELRAAGLALHEIAGKLGITCRTAESHLDHARRKVRARLAQTLALLTAYGRWRHRPTGVGGRSRRVALAASGPVLLAGLVALVAIEPSPSPSRDAPVLTPPVPAATARDASPTPPATATAAPSPTVVASSPPAHPAPPDASRSSSPRAKATKDVAKNEDRCNSGSALHERLVDEVLAVVKQSPPPGC